MFLPFEVQFLANKLNDEIVAHQATLSKGGIENDVRESIEREIIISIAILNKLEKGIPKAKNKQPAKVLIVDDVDSMRQVNKHILRELGFTKIELAEDGKVALNMLQKAVHSGTPFELVISDWEMPKMDGIELLKIIRSSSDLWRTHVYLLTSMTQKKDVMEAIKSGASGYMTKPINHNVIKEKLKDYL